MSTSKNLTPDNNDDFYAEILAEAETLGGASTRLPFCQAINPKKGFEKRQVPNYGLFIPPAEAEQAGFEPDGVIWKAHTHTFDAGNSEEGFLAVSPRVVIIYKSETETYLPGLDGSPRYAGPAFKSDSTRTPNALRKDAKLATRYLLGFVNNDNQLLHHTPFGLKASGGFGGAFSEEVGHLRRDFTKALAKVIKLGGVDSTTHTYCVGAFDFSGFNPSKGQPYLTPVARALPLLRGDQALEESVEVGRKNGRVVKVTGTELSSLFIIRTNPSRAVIDEWREAHQSFPEPPGKQAEEQPQAPAREEAEDWKGTFDLGKVVFSIHGGDKDQATVPFTRVDGRVFAATMDANLFTGLSGETCAVWGWVEGGKGLTVTAATNLSDNVPF